MKPLDTTVVSNIPESSSILGELNSLHGAYLSIVDGDSGDARTRSQSQPSYASHSNWFGAQASQADKSILAVPEGEIEHYSAAQL